MTARLAKLTNDVLGGRGNPMQIGSTCVSDVGSNLENGNLPLQPFLLVGRDASLVESLAEALSLEALGGL